MKPALIFDLDGTLVDSVGDCAAILGAMRAERGDPRPIDLGALRPLMSRGGAAMVAAILGAAARDTVQDLAEFRTRYADYDTPVSSLFPGVAAGLASLHAAGFALAVCSNKPQHLCERVLADVRLARLFDVIVGGTPDRRPKPAPDLIALTLSQLDRAAAECCYIGDSELDHQAAAATDVPFAFVRYGYADPSWHAIDCPGFDRFSQLVDHFCDARAAQTRVV